MELAVVYDFDRHELYTLDELNWFEWTPAQPESRRQKREEFRKIVAGLSRVHHSAYARLALATRTYLNVPEPDWSSVILE